MKIKCRKISKGIAIGDALVSSEPISFFGGVDPKTGEVIDRNHALYGKNISNRILVFPSGKGSTVGSYVLYQLKKNNVAPAGIICKLAEPIVAVGAIISEIPMVDGIEFEFKDNQKIKIDADSGYIEAE